MSPRYTRKNVKGASSQQRFEQYPKWLQERIIIAKEARAKGIAAEDDSTRVAYQKHKHNQSRAQSQARAQDTFFEKLFPSERMGKTPLGVLERNFKSATERNGGTLTIGEAFEAEIARQKQLGYVDNGEALINLRTYLNEMHGETRLSLTKKERAEYLAELRRLKTRKPNPFELQLSIPARLAYEAIQVKREWSQHNPLTPVDEKYIYTHAIIRTKNVIAAQEKAKVAKK